MIRILIALGIVSGLIQLFKHKKGKLVISESSNCQDEFDAFNENLEIPPSKMKRLKQARKAIQNAIQKYFENQKDFTTPKFYLQGSYASGTMIRNSKDQCDFDIGLYFFQEPSKGYSTIQNHIKKALTGHTTAGINLLSRCVRLKYQGDFNIDMPVYYTTDGKLFYLGNRDKEEEWELCDSKIFKDWVINGTKDNPQKIRIIRYLKAWSDHYHSQKRIKMPSGLVFTIWAIQFYQPNERDDVALVHTSAAILKHLNDNFQFTCTCKMPVTPNDNVLDRLSKKRQSNFCDALHGLVSKGFEAVSSDKKTKAIKIWGKLLGKRFPDLDIS
ncbi:MAG: nucleotidyltransferase [Cyclobacteriaceae bacterium]|nr:nucleotidyltransferase [Cyclobacteriaceae bacterium]